MNTAYLHDAITEFRDHSYARGLAKNTIENRLQVLNKALDLWGNIQVRSIAARHIDMLFSVNRWSSSTSNLYLGQLRIFFDWCRAHKYMPMDEDPTLGWRSLRVERKEKLRIPVAQFNDLLDSCRHPLDRMVCALGLYTFLRGSEMSTLRVEDVRLLDSDTPVLSIYRHKTKEADSLPICEELRVEIHRWYVWLSATIGIPQPHWFLTPRRLPDSKYFGASRIAEVLEPVDPTRQFTHPYRAVQRALKVLDYPTLGEGEHTLRRSGARALFDELRLQGYDGALMRVSSMLGHKSSKVTETYIGLGLERQQRNEQLSGKLMFPSVVESQVIDATDRFGGVEWAL
jgi:integrase